MRKVQAHALLHFDARYAWKMIRPQVPRQQNHQILAQDNFRAIAEVQEWELCCWSSWPSPGAGAMLLVILAQSKMIETITTEVDRHNLTIQNVAVKLSNINCCEVVASILGAK